VPAEVIYTFDDRVRALNGACLLSPGVLAVADCAAGLIWRVDLSDGARKAAARVWLADDTMAWDPDSGVTAPQPGINGVRRAMTVTRGMLGEPARRGRHASWPRPGRLASFHLSAWDATG
jgi:hypothetical protein